MPITLSTSQLNSQCQSHPPPLRFRPSAIHTVQSSTHQTQPASSITSSSGSFDDPNSTERPVGRRRRLFRKVRRGVRKRLGGKESALLVLYTLGLLVSSCGNAIFFKKMTNAMPNYSWFLSQITCFAYIPIFGVVVILAYSKGDITEEMTKFPKHNFAIMGLLDGLVCLMCIVGGAFTSGPAQLVLGQAVIPVTLGLATLFLAQKFHFLQYIGALIIIAGVMASKWPLLVPSYRITGNIKDIPLFNLIYACSAFPGALSQIWKELAFKDRDLNVNYMQYWVAVYQIIVGFLTAPLNALPILGPQQIPLENMPSMITGGSACLFLGKNSIVENCGGYNQPICDKCTGSWIPVVTYLVFNIFYNSFTLLIVKHGGAALSFVIATLRLPLTTICFYSTAIMGADATDPALGDLVGLIVLVAGLAVYRYGSAIRLEQGVEVVTTQEGQIEFPLPERNALSTALDVMLLPDEVTLLTVTEDDEEGFFSEGDEVSLASLVVEPGPYILKIHHHHTRPLYLRPIQSLSGEIQTGTYQPPNVTNNNKLLATVPAERPPRRRTMHDFREAQIQKIHQRRLPIGSPSPILSSPQSDKDNIRKVEDLSSTAESNGRFESEEDGYLSDGSVNSLTGTSRPHPLEYSRIMTDTQIIKESIEDKQSVCIPLLEPNLTPSTCQFIEKKDQVSSISPTITDSPSVSLRGHLTPLPPVSRLPLSVMLNGGLDLAVASPKVHQHQTER